MGAYLSSSVTHTVTAAAPRNALFLLSLAMGELTGAVQFTMVYAVLPSLTRAFGDPLRVSWVITCCLLVHAVAAALCARLGDLFGRRRILMALLLACGVGAVVSAFSSSLAGIVVGTALQGLTGAVMPLCFGLAHQHSPRDRAPIAIGIIVAGASVGGGAGLLLGGWLVDSFGWPAVYKVGAAASLAAAALLAVGIPRDGVSAATRSGLDPVRGIVFAPAVLLAMFGVVQARQWGLGDVRVLGLLAAATAILAWWARHQWRQANPLIAVRLFAIRPIAAAYFGTACLGLGALQSTYLLNMILQQPVESGGFGLSATAAGAILGPATWVGALAGPLAGKTCARFGSRFTAALGFSLLIVGWAVIGLARDSVTAVAVAASIAGIGMPVVYSALPSLIVEHAPPSRISEATGIAGVMRAIFMSLGAAFVAVFMTLEIAPHPATGVPYPTPAAIDGTVAWIVALTLAALAAVLASGGRRPAGESVESATSAGGG